VKYLVRILTTFVDLMFLRGIASGKRVDAHIMVKRYWFPDLFFGSDPSQSTITLLNGSSNAGIGWSETIGICWLGLPTTWQV